MADVVVAQEQSTGSGTKALLVATLLGAAVAVGLGVYANGHDPAGQALFVLWFSGTINMKAWFTTAAMVLVLVQVGLALWMYGKLGRQAPAWVGSVHRLVGLAAFLLVLPVAYHCLWSLGLESNPDHTRRFVHSMLGCAFFGAFTVKVLAVRSSVMPSWALPVLGGLVFAGLTGLWLTSALWFFQNVGFPSF
ncbi:MAG TPA: DUF6529 family protein [Acidimicrobiales bacterium]